jgi:hypothetical protein
MDTITSGDTLVVKGKEGNVRELTEDKGWTLKEGLELFGDDLARNQYGSGRGRRSMPDYFL